MQLETPIGPLTVTATKKAVTAIHFGTQGPGGFHTLHRGGSHAPAAQGRRRDRGLFRRLAAQVHAAPRPRRNALPAEGLGGTAHHPLRRDPHLQADRHPDRPQPVVPGRRHGQQPQSDCNRRPLPPGHRLRRQTHGICRRARHQGAAVGIGETVVRRIPEPRIPSAPPRRHPYSGRRSASSR